MVTIALKIENTTLSNGRYIFDDVINTFTCTSKQLSKNVLMVCRLKMRRLRYKRN